MSNAFVFGRKVSVGMHIETVYAFEKTIRALSVLILALFVAVN